MSNSGNMELSACIINEITVLQTKKGDPYLSMEVKPHGGKPIRAKKWQANEEQQKLKVGDIIVIEGKWDAYQGNEYVNITSLDISDGEVDPNDFMDRLPKDIQESLEAKFKDYKDSVKVKKYKVLLAYLFNKRFLKKFFTAPAARKFHHAYLGGLLEHTIETTNICMGMVDAYYPSDMINRELLITSALLHDIGKCYTYTWDKGAIELLNCEYMTGHISKGIELVSIAENKLEQKYPFVKHLVAARL